MLSKFRKWLAIRRHVAILGGLDDRLLADMGLSRRHLREQVTHGIVGAPAPAEAVAGQRQGTEEPLPMPSLRLACP